MPPGDSRAFVIRNYLTDRNGTLDFMPEYSQYDNIILGSANDMTKIQTGRQAGR